MGSVSLSGLCGRKGGVWHVAVFPLPFTFAEPRASRVPSSDEEVVEEPQSRRTRMSLGTKGLKVNLFPGLSPSALKVPSNQSAHTPSHLACSLTPSTSDQPSIHPYTSQSLCHLFSHCANEESSRLPCSLLHSVWCAKFDGRRKRVFFHLKAPWLCWEVVDSL